MDVESIVKKVVAIVEALEARGLTKTIPIEVSARHVHLSQKDTEKLFGVGATLTAKRPLSQTGQFLSEQRVRIVGPKGTVENVAVLGPERSASQVEISATDARALGIEPILRESGDIKESAPIVVSSGINIAELTEGCIVAKNHIHMNEKDAEKLGLVNKQLVNVRVKTQRPMSFNNVVVRVDPTFVLNMHIDFDEANACLASGTIQGEIF